MVKATSSKAIVMKTNLAFLAFFIFAYLGLLLLQPYSPHERNPTKLVQCSLHDCPVKQVEEMVQRNIVQQKQKELRLENIPKFLQAMPKNLSIGLVNMREHEVIDWGLLGRTTVVEFEPVSKTIEWKDLFPEWIDEEEENELPKCPEIPMPNFKTYSEMLDLIVVKLPCSESGSVRDVFRLQVHLVAANLVVQKGRRDMQGNVQVVFLSTCAPPMIELFRCEELLLKEGQWLMYETGVDRLQQKVALPVGSCMLALPLKDAGNNNKEHILKLPQRQRKAYATVLHSSDAYVCGAIILAQSIRNSGSIHDLLLLHDSSLPADKLNALVSAGWSLRLIDRIHNPNAEKDTYNEYNYSKLRLWQLTDYQKIIFIDADIIVLRNLDHLFEFPELAATGNDGVIFNSGVMVIQPSNCTFKTLMARRNDVFSYNGGDQGFLNEVFVWWHRLPKRMNYLKNFWSNTTEDMVKKNRLFAAEPPELYAIHYLGLKPWLCYRDYDCNWNVGDQRVYASDEANKKWWKVHDRMEERLQKYCMLSDMRKVALEVERKQAELLGFADEHWKLNVSASRRNVVV